MPVNVRNFWIDLEVDGRKEKVGTGPRTKDGGFYATISIRRDGCVDKAMHIEGKIDSSGDLLLIAEAADGDDRIIVRSKR